MARIEGTAEEAYFLVDGKAVPLLDEDAVASDLLKRALHFGVGYREVVVDNRDIWPNVTLYGMLQETAEGVRIGTVGAEFGKSEAAGAFISALPAFLAANAQEIGQTLEVVDSSEDGVAYGGTDAAGLPFVAFARQIDTRVVAVQVGLTIPSQIDSAACRDELQADAEQLLDGFGTGADAAVFGIRACIRP